MWHYKTCMQVMLGVSKTTQHNAISWINKHKYQSRHGQHTLKLDGPSRGKNNHFQGQQGERVALSFLGPQATILPSEIAQDFSGEEAQTQWSQSSTKMAQNKGQTSLKRGQTTPKLNTPFTNYLEQTKTRLYMLYTKLKNRCKIGK